MEENLEKLLPIDLTDKTSHRIQEILAEKIAVAIKSLLATSINIFVKTGQTVGQSMASFPGNYCSRHEVLVHDSNRTQPC